MIYELSYDGYRLGLFPTEAAAGSGRSSCPKAFIRSGNGA